MLVRTSQWRLWKSTELVSIQGRRHGPHSLAKAFTTGLARAFFYAGGRSLLVSHWEVDSPSAVELMVGTFAAIADDPNLSHGEALRKSMLAMIGDARHPEWAAPNFWAPFVVVGEPAKPTSLPNYRAPGAALQPQRQ
jgi:hypothetical protein